MVRIALLIALVALPITASAQGFILKKSQWDEMNAWAKDAYVAGYLDGVSTQWVESVEQNKYTGDLFQCIIDLELTTQSIVQVVETEYQDLDNWDKGPYAVIMSGMRRVCLNKINEYRQARGDTLLEP